MTEKKKKKPNAEKAKRLIKTVWFLENIVVTN